MMNETKTFWQSRTIRSNLVGLVASLLGLVGFFAGWDAMFVTSIVGMVANVLRVKYRRDAVAIVGDPPLSPRVLSTSCVIGLALLSASLALGACAPHRTAHLHRPALGNPIHGQRPEGSRHLDHARWSPNGHHQEHRARHRDVAGDGPPSLRPSSRVLVEGRAVSIETTIDDVAAVIVAISTVEVPGGPLRDDEKLGLDIAKRIFGAGELLANGIAGDDKLVKGVMSLLSLAPVLAAQALGIYASMRRVEMRVTKSVAIFDARLGGGLRVED